MHAAALMSSQRVQFVILCEDQRSRDFLRRYLKRSRASVTDRQIRVVPYPAGKGCGFQHVLDRYAAEVRAMRRVTVKAALMVMVDADACEVSERLDQLDEALRKAAVPVRQMHEPVALLVPKRNIQTWIEHLRADPPAAVDEGVSYPEPQSTRKREHWAPAVDRLVTLLSESAAWPDCPPSLEAARAEFARLP